MLQNTSSVEVRAWTVTTWNERNEKMKKEMNIASTQERRRVKQLYPINAKRTLEVTSKMNGCPNDMIWIDQIVTMEY